ncbi:hypothetical protein ACFV3E_24805 [Streptomyces sp. NPDC059718]
MSAPAQQTSAERTALQVARVALQSADTAYGIPDAIVSALSERGLLMDPEIAAVMASAGPEIQRLNERIVELEAGIAWRDAERGQWADVHSLVERAIDKGYSSVDTYLLEDALHPNAAAELLAQRHQLEDPAEPPLACPGPPMGGAS